MRFVEPQRVEHGQQHKTQASNNATTHGEQRHAALPGAVVDAIYAWVIAREVDGCEGREEAGCRCQGADQEERFELESGDVGDESGG